MHISDTHVPHLGKENMNIITVGWLDEYCWMHISRIHLDKEKNAAHTRVQHTSASSSDGFPANNHVVEQRDN